MTEHRVPMLGGAWRRRSDPARSPDPRVRELVGALAGLEVAPAMRAEFRSELRAQLVAVTPRLVAEGEPTVADTATNGRKAANVAPAEAGRRFRFAKPLIAVACALTAFVLLLGGAVLISRHALPGDALYGIKRASEDTEYSLTSGSVAKGKLKLDFAATRIGEVADLLHTPSAMAAGTGALADSGRINSGTAGLVQDTLGSARSDVYAASQMLNGEAVRNHDPAALTAITSWAPAQITAMRTIVRRIPAGSLHQYAARTLSVLEQARQRSAALSGELGCSCLTSSTPDAFGPVPCATGCSATPRTTKAPDRHPASGTRTPSSSRTHPVTGPTTAAPRGGTGPGTVRVPNTSPTRSAPGGHQPQPSTTIVPTKSPIAGPTSPTVPGLPTLPGIGGHSGTGTGSGKTGPKLPITVTSSCVSAGVGGIGVHVGNC